MLPSKENNWKTFLATMMMMDEPEEEEEEEEEMEPHAHD